MIAAKETYSSVKENTGSSGKPVTVDVLWRCVPLSWQVQGGFTLTADKNLWFGVQPASRQKTIYSQNEFASAPVS
jgi:hypothetical protein